MARKKNLKNKKDTIKVVEKKESILSKLYHNKLLRTKVDNALDEDMSFDDIIDICKEYDLDISKPSLSRYKNKRREAIQNGWDLGELIDKRKKTSVDDISDKEVSYKGQEIAPSFEEAKSYTEKIYNDAQILDEIIYKGREGLKWVDTLDPALMIRAIETKNKITNGELKGLSYIGLKELMLKQTARESAMTEVLLEFIPEEQHEQVLQRLEEKEKEFYQSLDLNEEDKKFKEAMEQAGISI
ncbi:MAG: hypothetical protein E6303_00145 [Clostridium perfringens]|nr:hypothetical protein [Clostridium perfringens]